LAKDLFEKDFDYLRGRYPLAMAAGDEIRQAIDPESKDALPLEDYLREKMRDSTDSYTRLRYRQIPLYLQDLLFAVGSLTGEGYTTDPDNYNALNNAVLKLDDVLFLTLNYDTLLDDRLFNYQRLETLDSYVASDSSFALVKLHGSVNWGRRLVGTLERGSSASREDINWFVTEVPALEFETGDIELRLQSSIADTRYEPREHAVFYPALSVPLGPADEFVCPPSHRAAAQKRLAEAESLNVLVIGYSGNDRECLNYSARAAARSGDCSLHTDPGKEATRPQSAFRAHAGGATSSKMPSSRVASPSSSDRTLFGTSSAVSSSAASVSRWGRAERPGTSHDPAPIEPMRCLERASGLDQHV
jgi:hypothetical protein